jgi:hypothetical protein
MQSKVYDEQRSRSGHAYMHHPAPFGRLNVAKCNPRVQVTMRTTVTCSKCGSDLRAVALGLTCSNDVGCHVQVEGPFGSCKAQTCMHMPL